MNSQAVNILRDARQRIEIEDNWTKRCMARDKHFNPVSVYDKNAYSWCALGAIFSATEENFKGRTEALLALAETIHTTAQNILCEQQAKSTITDFNDDTVEHEDILSAFDNTIRSLSQ